MNKSRYSPIQLKIWLIGVYLLVINLIASEAAIEPIKEKTGKNSYNSSVDDLINVLKISFKSSHDNSLLLNVGFLICSENDWWFIKIG